MRAPSYVKPSQKRYYALQGVGWGIFSVMHVLFSTMNLPFNVSTVVNGVFIGATGLLVSHGLRLCYLTHWFNINQIWSLLVKVLLCVLVATALWELAIIVVLHIGMLNYYDWKTISIPAAIFWYYYYFVVLSLWSLLYFSSKIVIDRRRDLVEKLQLEIALRDATLQNLKWQMNPHFLFNSLNSVRAMIRVDPDKAREMVTQMSGLLRQSLRSTERQTIPLHEELDSVRAYLALEKVRFEERLEYEIEVDDALLEQPVLPMSLQTLVENALKHGISQCPRGGWVKVRVAEERNQVLLTVQNSGQFDASAPQGTGLSNTRARLQLVFGEGAGLAVSQQGDDSVEAILWLTKQ
ncbi:sensor histidine kinase [Gilvimarinus sp. DA14]|uniref:sensor histidine kinase n=1 Tax=Gilvimarinus sp. DA14 TaxID=2956798 RepID=UPI0020B7E4BF|nr:histidine kinase [Gilvimarinus sp. DA14]UTF58797.1 histidine kinase [Gilvimarinus sp. DA14]